MTRRTASQLSESRKNVIFADMTTQPNQRSRPPAPAPAGTPKDTAAEAGVPPPQRPREIGGPKGPEPTRYGDWEFNGRCTDF